MSGQSFRNKGQPVFWAAMCCQPIVLKHSDHHSTGMAPRVGSMRRLLYLPCLAHTDCSCCLLASPLSGKWHRVCYVAKCSERNEEGHDSPAGLRTA